MKLEEIRNEIKKIEAKEKSQQEKVNADLETTKAKLEEINDKLEETYSTGDTKKGQELIKVKVELEEQIAYLETYVSKRATQRIISNEDAKKYVEELTKITNVSYDEIVEKLRKFTNDIVPLVNKATSEREQAKEIINYMYRNLLKDNSLVYTEDYNKTGVYLSIGNFYNNLKSKGL